jgi:hypothetical protein
LVLSSLSICVGGLGFVAASEPADKPKPFVVYDNMIGNKDRPDPVQSGLEICNIIYGTGTPKNDSVATQDVFKNLVTERAKKPGPIVIDIEDLKLYGDKDQVEQHFELFMTLIKWAHEAAPGRVFGYYGEAAGLFPNKVGAPFKEEAKKLAGAVDAFFPSMYVSNDDRKAWTAKAQKLVADAHGLAPGKPVYFYLMPYYHEGSPKALQYIDGDYWSFQLHESQRVGADGVVLWEGSKKPWTPGEWWPATLKFVSELKSQ